MTAELATATTVYTLYDPSNINSTQAISDSGAGINCIPPHEVQRLNLHQCAYSQPIQIVGVNATAPIHITHYIQSQGLIGQLAIVPNSTKSLIATSTFTNQGLVVTYTQTEVIVADPINGEIIVTGTAVNGFWKFDLEELLRHSGRVQPITTIPTDVMNLTLSPHSQQHLVDYCHLITGRPPIRTFANMIQREFIQNFFPITIKMINRYPPNLLSTAKGHQRLIDKHTVKRQPPTKRTPTTSTSVQHSAITLPSNPPPSATSTPSENTTSDDAEIDNIDDCYEDIAFSKDNILYVYKIINIDKKYESLKRGTLYQDGTGAYPSTTESGAKYILAFKFNGYIHLEPITTPSGSQIVKATENTIDYLLARKADIKRHVLDNTFPAAVKSLFQKQDASYQLVPPRNHRANRAEYAVNIVKKRMVTMRSDIDPTFNFDKHWDKLLPRLEININISLPNPSDPTQSTWHGLHKQPYNFLTHPFIPPACICLIHVPRDDRKSWDDRGIQGFALEPSMEHHRATIFHIPSTSNLRISSSYSAHPHRGHLPGSDNLARLTAAMSEIDLCLKRAKDNKQIDDVMSANITQQMAGLRQFYAPIPTLQTIPDGIPMRNTLEIVKNHPLSVSLDTDKISAMDVKQQLRDKAAILKQARKEHYNRIQPPEVAMIVDTDTTTTANPQTTLTFHLPRWKH